MKIIFKKSEELHPENIYELEALCKKWSITLNELCRAIVETGTTNTKELKAHLRAGKFNLRRNFSLRRIYAGMYIVRP